MVNRIALVSLLVRDYDEAVAWFTGPLGFDLVADTDLGGGQRWVVVAPAGGGHGLVLGRPTEPEQVARIGDQTGGRVFLFLQTDDFAAEHSRLLAAGVEFLEEPRHEPYGTVAVFRDLLGNKWDLVQYAQ